MMIQPMTILRSLLSIQSTLSPYHPLLIEGHTRDARDPSMVATQIVTNLRRSWGERNITKPPILITQGDPLTERGISAITRLVAQELGVKRCLICLDENIDAEHAKLADRHDVVYELRYSQLVDILNNNNNGASVKTNEDVLIGDKLTQAIDAKIAVKNGKRSTMGKEELADWYRQYALLQGEYRISHFFGICFLFDLIII